MSQDKSGDAESLMQYSLQLAAKLRYGGQINDGYTFQFRSCGVGGNHYKTFFFMHEIVPVRTYGTYGLDSTSPHKKVSQHFLEEKNNDGDDRKFRVGTSTYTNLKLIYLLYEA
jgi:hypothetical protein